VVLSMLIFLPLDKTMISILIGGLIIVVGGVIDDLKELKPKYKLIVQILAAVVLVIGGIRIEYITNPFAKSTTLLQLGWLSIPITLFWVVGITNTLNFIDGLDGLSAGVATISSLSL